MTGEELGRFLENLVLVVGTILLFPVFVVFGLLKMESYSSLSC